MVMVVLSCMRLIVLTDVSSWPLYRRPGLRSDSVCLQGKAKPRRRLSLLCMPGLDGLLGLLHHNLLPGLQRVDCCHVGLLLGRTWYTNSGYPIAYAHIKSTMTLIEI
jgi:hypothetical protein